MGLPLSTSLVVADYTRIREIVVDIKVVVPANGVGRQERLGIRAGGRVVNRISFRRAPEGAANFPVVSPVRATALASRRLSRLRTTNAPQDGRKLRDYYLSFYAPKFLIPISCSRLSVVMSHFLIRTRSATIMQ
jgi:hypothetical protein